MGQSITEFIDYEYKKNIEEHKKQAAPILEFMRGVLDKKYKDEEAAKVRGQQINDLSTKYYMKTGDTGKIEVPEHLSPEAYFEILNNKYDESQAPLLNRQKIVNEAQKKYYNEIQQVGELGENEDPEEWYGKLEAKSKANATKTTKPDKNIFYNRETGEKTTIVKIDKETQTGETLTGKKVDMNKYTESSKEEEPKPTSKYEEELAKGGFLEDIQKLMPTADEKTYQKVYTRVNKVPRAVETIGSGKNKRVVQVQGAERVRRALQHGGSMTIDEIDKQIKFKQALLNKSKKSFWGIDPLKKDSMSKELKQELETEIKELQYQRKDTKLYNKIFKGIEMPENKKEVVKKEESTEKIYKDTDRITYGEWNGTYAQFKARLKETFPEKTDEQIEQVIKQKLMKAK